MFHSLGPTSLRGKLLRNMTSWRVDTFLATDSASNGSSFLHFQQNLDLRLPKSYVGVMKQDIRHQKPNVWRNLSAYKVTPIYESLVWLSNNTLSNKACFISANEMLALWISWRFSNFRLAAFLTEYWGFIWSNSVQIVF